ncbi:response regulator [Undibacterium sp. Di27W]|uniref:hybrid sensor histidine kinase/response regulator n=1 Tax=Undibacterium sp. Di27W TaxID=3413036 RepID=UPI003BF36C7B
MKNNTITILNVDDNDGARYFKTRILKNAGFNVVEAANGTDALTLVSKVLPALVLLDVKLPDINGIEVCRRIKEELRTASILVLQTSAALTGRDDKIRGLDGGADNYLAAPIEADELISNVNALLRLRQTQADLRNSDERFRQLTDNIDDVFWMFSLDNSELLYVSQGYESFWGRPNAALQENPKDWMDSIHPEDRVEALARWDGLWHNQAYEYEYRLVRPKGSIRWVRDRAFLVPDSDDVPYRIARITSDISVRKEMEGLLHKADANKNNFLATLAHELRNPLSPIRNAVLLMSQTDDLAKQESARHIISRQLDHLTHLVDDLLDVARISEGKLTLRMQEVELNAVLSAAVETIAPAMEKRQHTFAFHPPTQPIWLSGDPTRLAQAVGNLLHNAAKFTNIGGAIELVVKLTEKQVSISVRDNGIGITPYNLPRIFSMFAQGEHAPDSLHEGLGIGLSLVSNLIWMHGGNLTADSAGIDQGSVFTIHLPVLDKIFEADAQVSLTGEAVVLESASTEHTRILLVDDNIDSVEIMAALLEAIGHTVYTATNAPTAIKLALTHLPEVILLDIGLPDTDGYELARILRAKPEFATTRLVAHTGYGSPQDRIKTSEAGFDYHLVKPADFEALVEAVRIR